MIGVHIDVTDNLVKQATIYLEKGCRILQLFVSPNPSNSLQIEYAELKKFASDNKIHIVVHISYTINCAQPWNTYSWWIRQACDEIKVADMLGAFAVVIHMGKSGNQDIKTAYDNMYQSLLYIYKQTIKYPHIRILLETPAGQGTEICSKLEDFMHFFRKLSKNINPLIQKRFGCCIDTCHIFSAGYDIRNISMIEKYLDDFNEMIGIKHVGLIHLNDAMKGLGSHVDRHQNIGKGYIGRKGLFAIVDFFTRLSIPLILETPLEGIQKDIKLIQNRIQKI